MYIYDDRGKDKGHIEVVKVLAVHGEYQFVLLEDGGVGLVNTESSEFISDDHDFYFVGDIEEE